ncbi:MAG: hypothetical protein JJT94_10930 [Bernardetiaceae bacterium]|nr:hypothetical protein [Bernardetiaceae bacterium]
MNLKPTYITLTAICLLFLMVMMAPIYSRWKQNERIEFYQKQRHLAQTLLLSDFCLSTESRHTRHLNNSELIGAFQDFPAYHDHFPSSSFFRSSIISNPNQVYDSLLYTND